MRVLLRPHPGPFLLRLLLGQPHSHLQVCLSRRRQIIFNYLFLGTSNSRGPPLNSLCPMSFRVSAGCSVEILESLIMALLTKACSRNNGTEQGCKSTQGQKQWETVTLKEQGEQAVSRTWPKLVPVRGAGLRDWKRKWSHCLAGASLVGDWGDSALFSLSYQ